MRRLSEPQRRTNERGFTLIEAVVSMAILSIVAGTMATVFSVGFHVVAAGGPKDRMTGAHDFMVLEQALGKDAARAACFQVQGTVYGQTSSTCSSSSAYGQVSGCSSALLCIGWPDVGESSCHVAVYVQSAGIVRRTESRVSGGGVVSVVSGRLTEDTVIITFGPILLTTAPSGYRWLRSLPINVKATGVTAGQFSQTLTLHPVATDPDGAASAIAQGSLC
jgi:prepilin-type N-terminal cleavage/methylation domain-containing protein